MAGSIATAYVQILPSFKGGAAAIQNEIDGPIGKAGEEGGKKYGTGMASSIKSMATTVFAPLIAAGAAFSAVQFFKGSIEEASGINESVNAINVSFGSASEGVQALGKASAENLGLSNLEFNNLAVRFSSFSKTIAGDGGDVTGTLADLTGRASDFASVMNLEVSDAAELFQSGLAGESEPLRKYGIDMSAATVEAYGLANGLAANGKSLTESEKVQARYGVLMQQTAATQGDFSNTSDQLANKQRITAAEFDNVKARIGTGLLPAMSALVGFVGDTLLPGLDDLGTYLTDTLIPGVQSFAQWVSDSQTPLTVVAGVLTAIFLPAMVQSGVAAVVSGAQVVGSFVAQRVAAVASAAGQWVSMLSMIAGWVASGAAAVASGAETVAIWALYKIQAVQGAASVVLAHAQMAAAWVASKIEAGISAAASAAAWVLSSAQTVGALALQAGAFVGQKVAMLATAAATGVVTAAQWLLNAAMSANPIALIIIAIVALVAGFVWLWNNVDGFRAFWVGAWDLIKGAALAVWDWIKANWPLLLQILTGPIGIAVVQIVKHWDDIKAAAQSVWQGIKDAWSEAGEFFTNIGDTIMDAFRTAINWVVGKWNDFSLTIGGGSFMGVDMPSVTLDTPNIPLLAEGAVVTGPTLAMIGEGPESEVVLPLSKLDALLNANGSKGVNLTVKVYPQPGMSEQQVGDMSARAMVRALAGASAS